MVQKENAFKNAEAKLKESKEIEATSRGAEAPVIVTGRQSINEDTIKQSKWLKLPDKEGGIGEKTEAIKIIDFYSQPGKMVKNNKGDLFWTGLTKKNPETNIVENVQEYCIEGTDTNGEVVNLRLTNWECVKKLNSVVRFCKSNNFTLGNQVVIFERVSGGTKTQNENWVLHCPTLKIKVEGEKHTVVSVK